MSNFSLIFSPTGGTARAAGILTAGMGGAWQKVDLCREVPAMEFGPEDVCLAAVAAVAEHSIFRQYAAGRPDDRDAEELREFAGKLRTHLDAGSFGDLRLAGSHGTYRDYGGVPFKPEGNKKCVGCGLCADGCPVSAIDPADPRKTDKDKCISCMRCVRVCPHHARDLNPLTMKLAALAMSKKLGGRKENHLFL